MRWHIAFTNLIEQELLGNNIENELHFSVIYRCPIHGQFGVTMYREGGGREEGVSEGTRNNIDVLFQNIAIYLSGHVSLICRGIQLTRTDVEYWNFRAMIHLVYLNSLLVSTSHVLLTQVLQGSHSRDGRKGRYGLCHGLYWIIFVWHYWHRPRGKDALIGIHLAHACVYYIGLHIHYGTIKPKQRSA